MAVLLPLLGARLAGIDSNLVSALQVIPTLFLLIGAFSLAEIELSPVVPGANDNASGVATVLARRRTSSATRPSTSTSGSSSPAPEKCLQEGMRSFVRAYREQLDPADTYVICVDTVGHGNVRYETVGGLGRLLRDEPRAWPSSATRSPRRTARRTIATAPCRFATGSPATRCLPACAASSRRRSPASTRTATSPDYHPPTDTPDRIDPEALERAHDFTLELIRQLDRDVGRRADD